MKKTKEVLCILTCIAILFAAGCSSSASGTETTTAEISTAEADDDFSDELDNSDDDNSEADEASDDELYEDEEESDSDEYSSDNEYSDDDVSYLYSDYDYGEWWGSNYESDEEFSEVVEEDNSGIDWDSVPYITNDDEAKNYFTECTDSRMTLIPVIYSDGYSLSAAPNGDNKCFLSITSLPWVNETVYSNDGNTIYLTYEVIYYPGTTVADAYLSGDTSGLSSDEMALYNKAVEIINEADKLDSSMRKELLIHDKICESVKYYTESLDQKMPRFCTAIGALIDGKANCQGYSDAFYMLMRMAGFNVGKQTGYANNGAHVWNVVNYGDSWYAVDVTWDDDAFALNDMSFVVYTYFNVSSSVMNASHSWDSYTEVYPIVSETDGRYFYYTTEADSNWFGQHAASADDIVGYVSDQLAAGDPFVYIMGVGFTVDVNNITTAVSNNLASRGLSGTFSVNCQTLGNNCFVYVDAAKRN